MQEDYIDPTKYRPYKQSQIIDNTICCLLSPKQIDEIRQCSSII